MHRLILILFVFVPHFAQPQIAGYLFDNHTLAPVSNAEVFTRKGFHAVSDSSGRFYFGNFFPPDTLIVSHAGYQKVILPLHNQRTIRIGMVVRNTQLGEVVISAAEFKRNYLSLPGSISLITRENIEKNGNLSVTESVNRIPGIMVQSGSLSTNRIIIRGIGSRSPYSTNRIKAYFEDIPLTTGEGVTTIEDIDLDMIGRMEIIRGPATGIYGAGLGGVMNIFTEKPAFTRFFVKASALSGSFGTFKTTLQSGYKKDNFLIQAGGNLLYSEGYRQNNQYNRKNLYAYTRYGYKNLFLRFFISHIGLKAFIPSSIDKVTYADHPEKAAANWYKTKGFEDYSKTFAGATMMSNISRRILNYITIYGSFFDQYELRPFNVLEDRSFSSGVRTRFAYQVKNFEADLGAEVFYENYRWNLSETIGSEKGKLLGQNRESRSYYNLFTHFTINLSKNDFLTAGININRLYYDFRGTSLADSSNKSGRRVFDPEISPRAGITHRFGFPLSVYLLISHGFSAPSLEETLNPEGMINPGLKPEEGWNFETGIRGEFFQQKVFLEMAWYTMPVKNLLLTKRISEEVFTGINAGRTSHKGIEAGLNYSSAGKFLTDIFFSGTYSVNRFVDFLDNGNNFSRNFIPGIPDLMLNAGVFRDKPKGLNYQFHAQYTGSMYLNDANSQKTPGYWIFDVKTGYTLLFSGKKSVAFYAGVQNLFNRKYASMVLVNATGFGSQLPRYYYPGLPVNFIAGLKFAWIN